MEQLPHSKGNHKKNGRQPTDGEKYLQMMLPTRDYSLKYTNSSYN